MNQRPAHDFRAAAAAALGDEGLHRAILSTTTRKLAARSVALQQLGDWDALRQRAAEIKQHTLDHLDTYLERFADRVETAGGSVHFAATAEDAVQIIRRIATEVSARYCVKSKSMATEEIDLNASLEGAGVQMVETDLGEYIVQLAGEKPSHIVAPAIHKSRRSIAELFERSLHTEYTEDPSALADIARRRLRTEFERADLGIIGVNFAIAETGTLCLCTNEGNGRWCATRPPVLIALMGLEKLVPRLSDLSLLLKLLARSSTGQAMTVYTTLITGPRRGDESEGPQRLHVVILDAGRTAILGSEHREVLRCIRCGACLNICPVYRQIGGHAYGSIYPGPIGKLVTPLFEGLGSRRDLPQASSLCGQCREVCPVGIDIPDQLLRLRRREIEERVAGWRHRWALRLAAWALRRPWRYRLAQRVARFVLGPGDRAGWIRSAAGPLKSITEHRDLPAPAKESFRQAWKRSLRDEA